MKLFQRLRRRKSPYAAVSEEEQISRYVYLLNTLPASVIESAHATAFGKLPAEKRREMFESLRPFMAESERDTASDDPIVLAKLIRRAEARKAQRAGDSEDAATAVATTERGPADARDAVPDPFDVMSRAGVTHLIAYQFVLSATVSTYFMYGAGAIALGDQPAWVGDMVDPGTAGYSGGDYGGYGGADYGGGGFDGGGFGGGFDGGGGGFG